MELRPAGDSTLLVLDAHAQAPRDQPEWGGRVAYLRDPSGNLIELFESLPQPE